MKSLCKSACLMAITLLLSGTTPVKADEVVVVDPATQPICTVQHIVRGNGALIAGTVDPSGNIIDNKGEIVGSVCPSALTTGNVIAGKVDARGNVIDLCGHPVGRSLRVVGLNVGSCASGTVDVNGDIISDDGCIIGHVPANVIFDISGTRVSGNVSALGNIVNGNGDVMGNVIGFPFVATSKTVLQPLVASTTTTISKESIAPLAVSQTVVTKTVTNSPAVAVVSQGDPSLGFQSHDLALRIDDALAKGQITSNKANLLRQRLLDINNMEASLAVDGIIDNKAARRIAFEYDRLNANLDSAIAYR